MPRLTDLLARDIARLENAGATIPAERAAVAERLAVLRRALRVAELTTEIVDWIDDGGVQIADNLHEQLKESLASDVAIE